MGISNTKKPSSLFPTVGNLLGLATTAEEQLVFYKKEDDQREFLDIFLFRFILSVSKDYKLQARTISVNPSFDTVCFVVLSSIVCVLSW